MDQFDRFCPACGIPQESQASQIATNQAPQNKYFRCENCGAEVAVEISTRSYVCPFCDSPYVVEFSPEVSDRQRPEFVIGFGVTAEQSRDQFWQWVKRNSWFRPGDLAHRAEIEEKLKGIYLPFWSFAMSAESNWDAEIGEYWWETQTYTVTVDGKTQTRTRQVRHTEWWPLEGRYHQYYNGYLVSGSRGLPQKEADRIKPFHLAALQRYNPGYLAGWMNEEYSISAEAALQLCQEVFRQRADQEIGDFLPGDTHRGLHTSTHFTQISRDLIFLPIYILSYRYKDKVYRFLVNGQTGHVAGDKPLSSWRIGGAIGMGLMLILVIVIVALILGR